MFYPTFHITRQLPWQGNHLAATKQRVLISYNLVLHLFCQKCLGEGKFVEYPQPEMLGAKVNTTTRPKLRGSDLDIIVFFSPGEHHSQ